MKSIRAPQMLLIHWPKALNNKVLQEQGVHGCCSVANKLLLFKVGLQTAVQSLSHVQLFATLWPAACQASLSFISWSLLRLMSIDSVIPPNCFILCCPLLLLPSIFPSIKVFSKESVLPIRWPKYWSFSFSINPSNDYSGLISFRIDWFDFIVDQRTQKSAPTPQLESIRSSVLSLLYGPTLRSIYNYWKNHSFDYMDLCQQSHVSDF